jgi:hypothetical protein
VPRQIWVAVLTSTCLKSVPIQMSHFFNESQWSFFGLINSGRERLVTVRDVTAAQTAVTRKCSR